MSDILRTVDLSAAGAGINGSAAAGFHPVVRRFAANFTSEGECGACLCIWHKGRKVVDIWGGLTASAGQQMWREDTVCLIFSGTKAATALCVHQLASRGLLHLDQPIGDIWPDYATAGKQRTTIRMALDHSAGLPVLKQTLKRDCLLDHAYMAAQLAAAEPVWSPGTRTAYHPLTMGFVLAELVRRISGRTLGTYFAEEIATPLGLDFSIGLADATFGRVAPIETPRKSTEKSTEKTLCAYDLAARTPGTVQNLFVTNQGDWLRGPMNSLRGLKAEIGSAGGVTNARSLAALYEALRPDGPLGFPARTLADFGAASSATHEDGLLLQPTRFSAGFMLNMDNRAGQRGDSLIIPQGAFGHAGAGGSVAFRDPAADLSFAYVMNRMGPGFLLNPRGQSLIDATYSAIGARPQTG